MEALEENHANGHSQKLTCNRATKVNGVDNLVLLFFTIFTSHFVLENIMTYGIIKTPIELTYDFIGFMQGSWWFFAVPLLGYLVQIVLCFFNEKGLAMGILSERFGMSLHLFISLFSFNLCWIVFSMYKFNPVAGAIAMGHIFLTSVKLWGYACGNKKLREVYKKNMENQNFHTRGNVVGKETVQKTITYPDNVTLRKTFQFLTCTSACIYRINCPSTKPRNLKRIFKGVLLSIFNAYVGAFLTYQYIFPELDKTAKYIDNGQYHNIFGSVLKLALPVNLTWFLCFYMYFFKFAFPAFGWFWGTEDIVVAHDWWNAENSTIFWTKFNYQIHLWLKEYFYLPLIRMGYGKRTAGFVVASVSGLLHDYVITVPFRCCYGAGTVAMLLQIPIAHLSTYAQRKYGAKWGNLVLWTSLMFAFPVCVILAYYNYTPS